MSIETWLTSFLDVVTETNGFTEMGSWLFFFLILIVDGTRSSTEREREREREVGTLLWKPWTRQVMKNVVPSCPFYYTETLTHSATFLFFIFYF